jgi:hypothetical protein
VEEAVPFAEIERAGHDQQRVRHFLFHRHIDPFSQVATQTVLRQSEGPHTTITAHKSTRPIQSAHTQGRSGSRRGEGEGQAYALACLSSSKVMLATPSRSICSSSARNCRILRRN